MLFKCKPLFLALMWVLFLVPSLTIASPREDAIKSGFIYNFARYSQGEWFNHKFAKNYKICSFSPEFVEAAKYTLKGLTIRDIPVIVSLLASEFDDIVDCNTLFISKSDTRAWNALLADNILPNAMLVGEIDDFIFSGGHIKFFIVGGKVRFEISPNKLKQAGINMSSKVLRLGRIYKGPL